MLKGMGLPTPSPAPPRFALGLAQTDVEEFRTVLREEYGVELALEDAWARAIETLAFARMVLEVVPDVSAPKVA